jgi:hypothetical protein
VTRLAKKVRGVARLANDMVDRKDDILFSSVDLANGEMAKDLLAERGIPSMLHSHGLETDATLGLGAIYYQLRVPRGRGAEARAVLEEVWGAAAVQKIEPADDSPGPFRAESTAGGPP